MNFFAAGPSSKPQNQTGLVSFFRFTLGLKRRPGSCAIDPAFLTISEIRHVKILNVISQRNYCIVLRFHEWDCGEKDDFLCNDVIGNTKAQG